MPIECTGPASPGVAPLARFAIGEYEANLRFLLGDAAVDGVATRIAALPADAPDSEEAFPRQDHRVSDRHIESYYTIADEVATAVRNSPDLRASVAGECARDGADATCLNEFIPRFMEAAFRRPPSQEDIDRVRSTAGEFTGNEQLHAVIFLTLMAPEFLYRFETRGNVNGGVLDLDAYDAASRLSYHFWGTAPDDELLRAAADGSLLSDAGFEAQVDRLVADARTEHTIMEFFSEWLHLEGGDFIDSARLVTLADGMNTDGLAEVMRNEVVDLIQYHLDSDQLTWRNIFTSNQSFARDERLASIYNVEPWDGTSEPPAFPAGERAGLLTRAGMLYTGDGSTNPFRRGIFIRRIMLCDEIQPPPNNLPADALKPPETQGNISTREAFTAKVVDQPCAGCHRLFSPLGYALEAYDGLGRFRTDERLVNTEGEDLGTVTVDTTAVPAVEFTDDQTIGSPIEMSNLIAESTKPNVCFARRYFRFTYRRAENSADECTVGSIAHRLETGEPLREALRSVALEPAFRQRRLEN
ncbi:MAG: DUF1592 domain-containing protein [Myxococcota bacterium]